MRSHNSRVKAISEFYGLSEAEAETAIKTLDEKLPRGYSSQVVRALGDQMPVTKQIIRHVKAGNSNNPILFNFLLDFAIKSKSGVVAAQKGIKEKLTV